MRSSYHQERFTQYRIGRKKLLEAAEVIEQSFVKTRRSKQIVLERNITLYSATHLHEVLKDPEVRPTRLQRRGSTYCPHMVCVAVQFETAFKRGFRLVTTASVV
jgi:hypothetical protein